MSGSLKGKQKRFKVLLANGYPQNLNLTENVSQHPIPVVGQDEPSKSWQEDIREAEGGAHQHYHQ